MSTSIPGGVPPIRPEDDFDTTPNFNHPPRGTAGDPPWGRRENDGTMQAVLEELRRRDKPSTWTWQRITPIIGAFIALNTLGTCMVTRAMAGVTSLGYTAGRSPVERMDSADAWRRQFAKTDSARWAGLTRWMVNTSAAVTNNSSRICHLETPADAKLCEAEFRKQMSALLQGTP